MTAKTFFRTLQSKYDEGEISSETYDYFMKNAEQIFSFDDEEEENENE